MFRIALIVWSLAATVFAGIVIIIVLLVPSFSDQALTYIPYGVIGSLVAAVPVSWVIAGMILKRFS